MQNIVKNCGKIYVYVRAYKLQIEWQQYRK